MTEARTLKDHIINQIIEVEGGYVDDPLDSGGATKYGITEAVAWAVGYTGPMRDLSRGMAFDIYAKKYWRSVNADQLEAISPALAAEVVDTAVNMGVERAAVLLQRSLNVFNQRGSLYDDISVDGVIGQATIAALNAYAARRDIDVLVRALNCLQGAAYIEIAERREKDERFVYGWLSHRVAM